MTDRPSYAEIVERLRADAAALEDVAGEPCNGSILLTEAAALIEALAERVRELEEALDATQELLIQRQAELIERNTELFKARQARKDQA